MRDEYDYHDGDEGPGNDHHGNNRVCQLVRVV